MATSGSFNTSSYDGRYLTFSWSIKSQDVSTNKTVINWSLKGGGDAQYSWYESGNFKVVINGSTVYSSSDRIKLYNGTVVASGTATISHNNDGSKTFSASAEGAIYNWAVNCTGNGSWALKAIPRYPTVTQTLSTKTETSITINWSSDAVIDYMWYSINDGQTWTGIDNADGKSGSYTITGLTPNTAYKVKTSLRRKDSQLWTNSTTLNVSTYAYPYAMVTPDFVIGNKVTIELYNPLFRQISVSILDCLGNDVGDFTLTGKYIVYVASAEEKGVLYLSIPNAQSGVYQVSVTYGSHTRTTGNGHYKINPDECRPTIGTATYRDVNPDTLAVTTDETKIIQNHSWCKFKAMDFSTFQGATTASCNVAVNGDIYDMEVYRPLGGSIYAETQFGEIIDSGQNVKAIITVTDSRGVTGTKEITVEMLSWQLPSAIISAKRRNNFYSETDIKVDADYSSLDGHNTIDIECRATRLGSETVIVGHLQDGVTAMLVLNNNFAWDLQIILTDILGGTTTYNVNVPRGMPIIYFDRLKESVGINCFPQDVHSLEVNGINVLDSIFYNAGDTVPLHSVNCAGMLTTSGKVLRYTLILPKRFSGLTPTITEMNLNIRNADGGYTLDEAFVSGGYDVLADQNITVNVISTGLDNQVTVELSKATPFLGTNNTPQTVTIESMTIEF